MTKKLKVIIGSSGYIGKVLTKELKKKKINFVGIDKNPRNSKFSKKIDLKNKIKTFNFFNNLKCDEIFHLGTYSAAAYKKNFDKCFKEDLASIQNLLYAIKKNKKKPKLVYMSSSYVYSGYKNNKSNKIGEKKALTPSHDFGLAKKFFEEYLTKYYSNSIIFRLSNVFGEGESISGNTALKNMATEAKNNNTVSVWGDGNRKIQYIYIGDLIKYLISDKKFIGIYNLGGEKHIKTVYMSKLICNYFGSKTIFLKNKKEDETLCFMNTNKIKKKTKNYFTSFEKNLIKYLKTI